MIATSELTDVAPSIAPTLDAHRMSVALDALSLKFVVHARAVARETLDIGCGDGIATAAALERGGYVLAVDPDPVFIERLRSRVPPERHARLRTQVGKLPEIDFDACRFSAIHAAHVLHLLSRPDVVRALDNMHHWLEPGGKLFLSGPVGIDVWLGKQIAKAGFIMEEVSAHASPWSSDDRCFAIVACRPARSTASRPSLAVAGGTAVASTNDVDS